MRNIGPDIAAAKALMAQIQNGNTGARVKNSKVDADEVAGAKFIGQQDGVMGVKDIPLDVLRGMNNITINNYNYYGDTNNIDAKGNATVSIGDNNKISNDIVQVDDHTTNNNQRTTNNNQQTTNNTTTNNNYNNYQGYGWGPYYPQPYYPIAYNLPPAIGQDPVALAPAPVDVDEPTKPEPVLMGPPITVGLEAAPAVAIVNSDKDRMKALVDPTDRV